MVQLMLEGMGGDRRKMRHKKRSGPSAPKVAHGIECYHVNSRVSQKLEDIGGFRFSKLLLIVGYCLQAIWCRFRYGASNFYYVPAPGKSSALYRDWLVLLLCRPFFKRVILHWHASGLAKWLETTAMMRSRVLTYHAAKQVDLSIVLSKYGQADADKLYPVRVAVVGNGIPDPCPDFVQHLLPRRRARLQVRCALMAGHTASPELTAGAGAEPQVFKVLFLGHCTRDKGLFEAVQGALLARQKLASQGSLIELRLVVAGQFVHPDEEAEFKQLCHGEGSEGVSYAGFVSGETKRRWLEEADGFCFPSYIESFGLVLVEAMAFGLPIVATRCGAIPEVLPSGYPGLVVVRDAGQVADALEKLITVAPFEELRRCFETSFTVQKHLANLATALHSVNQ
jgi:glycosyltransferase involved in cell wall biosynthesis